MPENLMSLEELECLYPGVGVNVTTMHANLLRRLCHAAEAAHELKRKVDLLRIANENLTNQLLDAYDEISKLKSS